MTVYIWLIFIYEVFGNLLTDYARRSMTASELRLSILERRLWKDNTILSLLAISFLCLVRFNGLAFLIYFGYLHVWWYPLLLWIGCLIATAIVASFFRGPTGLTIPALLGFLVLPVVGISLWIVV